MKILTEDKRSKYVYLYHPFLFIQCILILVCFGVARDPNLFPFKILWEALTDEWKHTVYGRSVEPYEIGHDSFAIQTSGNIKELSFLLPNIEDLRVRIKIKFQQSIKPSYKGYTFTINGTDGTQNICKGNDRASNIYDCEISNTLLKPSLINKLSITSPHEENSPSVESIEIKNFRASSARWGIWFVLTSSRISSQFLSSFLYHPLQAFSIPLILWGSLPLLRWILSKKHRSPPSSVTHLALFLPCSLFSFIVLTIQILLKQRVLLSSSVFFQLFLLPGTLYTIWLFVRETSFKKKTVSAAFPRVEEGFRKSSFGYICAIVFLYLLLTLLLTFPLIREINTLICGGRGDKYLYFWNFWWFNKALTGLGMSPFTTNYLHYPSGTSLLLSSTSLFNTMISIPLQKILSPVTIYNLLVLFSFLVAAVGMYILVFHLTASFPSSFIAGFIFSFCSYHFSHALGHLDLLSIEWIPFFIFYLIKSFQEHRIRHMVLTSLFFVLCSLCCWYYFVFCGLLLGSMVIYFVIPWNSRESRLVIKCALAILLCTLLIIGPLVGLMIVEKTRGHYTEGHPPGDFSADLASFLVPNFTSTYSMFFYPVWSRFKAGGAEGSNFLGYSVLLLLIYSLIKAPRPIRSFWLYTICIFFILSLGPFLNFLGQNLHVALPYLLYDNLAPFASFTGVPSRFHIMTTACVSILVGYGAKIFLEKMRTTMFTIRKKALCYMGITLFAIVMIIDHLHIPIFITTAPVSSFYVSMGRDPKDYAVIDMSDPPTALFYQTIHQKRLIGGYMSRIPPENTEFLKKTDVIRDVLYDYSSRADKDISNDPTYAREILEKYHVRYIVYPKHNTFYNFKKSILSYLGIPSDACGTLEAATGPLDYGKENIEKEAKCLGEELLKSRKWVEILKIPIKVRIFLSSQAETLMSADNRHSISQSESIVSKVWGFPLVYEDDYVKVYTTEL